MSRDNIEIPAHNASAIADRIVDTARQAGHLSHEARAVKSLAEDVIEDAVHSAKRAVRRGSDKLEDIKDEGVRYVKRQPLTTVAIAAGVGFIVGLTTACMFRHSRGSD